MAKAYNQHVAFVFVETLKNSGKATEPDLCGETQQESDFISVSFVASLFSLEQLLRDCRVRPDKTKKQKY